MNHLYFRVAEAVFDVDYREADDVRQLMPSYAPFHIPETEQASLFTMLVKDDLVPFSSIGKEVGQFDCGGINHGIYTRTDVEGYLILIGNTEGGAACALLTDKQFTHLEASLYGDTANRSFGLNNALMIAFAFAGAYHNIILMHSSVTMYKGGGHLFLGKSGTGKSTHSKGWLKYIEGTELLNDDNPALRYLPETDEVKVYGTPWSGKTPCYKNQSVPVRAVVRLEQYPENIIRRESTLPSFASVLSSTSTMIWDKASYKKICETISNIVRHVPTFYLKCLPDEAAVRMSSEAIDAYYQE